MPATPAPDPKPSKQHVKSDSLSSNTTATNVLGASSSSPKPTVPPISTSARMQQGRMRASSVAGQRPNPPPFSRMESSASGSGATTDSSTNSTSTGTGAHVRWIPTNSSSDSEDDDDSGEGMIEQAIFSQTVGTGISSASAAAVAASAASQPFLSRAQTPAFPAYATPAIGARALPRTGLKHPLMTPMTSYSRTMTPAAGAAVETEKMRKRMSGPGSHALA